MRWRSQKDWDSEKKGWEWLFHHIDTNSDGTISVEEYRSFQKFKTEQEDWEKTLRGKKKQASTGRLNRDTPNIVLIFSDDLGIEALNAYGGHDVRTPHIDKLSEDGVVFTHCFANPACSPSRAEIMTGTYPRFAGIKHVLAKWSDTYLDPKQFNSFANQLKKWGTQLRLPGSGMSRGLNATIQSRLLASMNIASGKCLIETATKDHATTSAFPYRWQG